MRIGLAALVTVLVFALAPRGSARADETADARAKSLFESATGKLDGGDLAGALADYRAAYELVPRAKILLNIGAVLERLGRKVEAADAFEKYVALRDADPARVPAVKKRLAKLDRALGKISIDVREQGSRVRLDDASIGVGPLVVRRRASAGSHVVLVIHADGRQNRYPVTVAAGSVTQLVVAVRERRVSPPVAPAAGASGSASERPAGSRRSLLGRPWLWTGVLAVAGLATGVTMGMQVRSLEDDIDSLNRESSAHAFSEARMLEDRAESRALYANVGFAVAGVAAALTAVLAIRDAGRAKSRRAKVGAAPRRGGGVFAVEVAF